MSWAAARSAPINANLFELAQPAINTPMTDRLDTASAKNTPTSSGTKPSTINVLIASVVPQPISKPITSSPVDVSEDEVKAREDRDDVGHVHAAQHPRQDRHVAERSAADLRAERARRALRDDVVTH